MIKAKLQEKGGLEDFIRDENINEGNVFALINCIGWDIRDFVEAEEREKLRPILRQTLLPRGETKIAGICFGFLKEWGILYAIPRPGTGTTIFGGSLFDCKDHDWDQSFVGN